jgi:site-specific recombinase XerD
LAARTIEHYTEAARIFLDARSAEDERGPDAWTAADVLRFVQRRALHRRPVHMQQVCVGLRAFFRYLRFSGIIECDLAACVPRIAHWRLATLPRFLTRAQVQQVLAGCDQRTAIGRRNYAILLLLARLGLRAAEVQMLSLEDVDWRSGQLLIRGKGRGPEPMPLPTDVGEALAAYLTNGRPASTSRHVFLRAVPPHTAFPNSATVTSIAWYAIRDAGIETAPKGAHVFRYTLATQMLRDGASLREIGQVLRHRDEDTTRIYAKLDLTRLRTLALPWPAGAR